MVVRGLKAQPPLRIVLASLLMLSVLAMPVNAKVIGGGGNTLSDQVGTGSIGDFASETCGNSVAAGKPDQYLSIGNYGELWLKMHYSYWECSNLNEQWVFRLNTKYFDVSSLNTATQFKKYDDYNTQNGGSGSIHLAWQTSNIPPGTHSGQAFVHATHWTASWYYPGWSIQSQDDDYTSVTIYQV